MKKEKSPLIGAFVSVAGFAFMIAGYSRGEASTVLIKAIRICLECIGIG